MADELKRRAAAVLELRRRKEREALAPAYDWYGDECPCGLELGKCRAHARARPGQRPPGYHRSAGWVASDQSRDPEAWRIAVYNAGRGAGKTRAAAEWLNHAAQSGTMKWAALVNETVKDVRDVMIEGPSGLLACAPPWFQPLYEPSKARVTWPNGAIATIYSAEQPNALRGPQFTHVWLDELPKWSFGQAEVWSNVNFCLRLRTEPRPRVFLTNTPQPTETYKEILRDPRTVLARGRTLDNEAQLDEDFIAYIHEKYSGTRLGRQELEAEILEDVPGALWNTEILEAGRVKAIAWDVDLVRVVISVDPQAGSNDPESSAETGIIASGKGSDRHFYVLEDCSVKGSPETWGKAVLRAYARHRADCIVVERNNGGDMVEHVIRSIQAGPDYPSGENVNIKTVWASRGKATRAEPVAALYEQNRAHHVGGFPLLESQLCTYNPDTAKSSPDRLDALVWGATELMLEDSRASGAVVLGGSRQSLYQR